MELSPLALMLQALEACRCFSGRSRWQMLSGVGDCPHHSHTAVARVPSRSGSEAHAGGPKICCDAARTYAPAFFPMIQKPLPNGSLQNAMGGCPPPSNFCSQIAPAANALLKTASRSSTLKSI